MLIHCRPQISPQDQETILELLCRYGYLIPSYGPKEAQSDVCRLLAPIGQHRANHITKSKGKRSKKRKRQEAKSHAGEIQEALPVPPTPEISSFIAVGLNSITRTLQAASRKPKPSSPPSEAPQESDPDEEEKDALPSLARAKSQTGPDDPVSHPPFSAIFVLRSSQPAILHAHLPQLIATASLAHPESPATRLVQLPRGSDERVCRSLGLPSASFIGLTEGAPHCKSLVELIQSKVPEIEVPWLEEVKTSSYMPVKINTVETFTSMPKKKLA